MLNTDPSDPEAALAQVDRLHEAGCELVRAAIPSSAALEPFARIVRESPIPVVADVHFDHRLAIEAARLGAAKVRINPGNIGSMDRVDAVVAAAGEAGIPLRIGVNAGSLAPASADSDAPLAEKLASSAEAFCEHIEALGFRDLVVSAKASSVIVTLEAYRLLAERIPYPLHLGVTEAGAGTPAIVKSAIGIGSLLEAGIGDTLRVSLTGDPVTEVRVAWDILAALDIRRRHPEIVSCPTCGRCGIDLEAIVRDVQARLTQVRAPIKIAVMGCAVNGPGEAREADVGVAAGGGVGVLFARGEELRTVPEDRIVEELFDEIARLGYS
jgi:(E)-4-hydroxy-3-methylbut-2-enyl-diphosphate synthase